MDHLLPSRPPPVRQPALPLFRQQPPSPLSHLHRPRPLRLRLLTRLTTIICSPLSERLPALMPHLHLQSRALPLTIDTLHHLRPSTLMKTFMRHLSLQPGWLKFLLKAPWSLRDLAPQDHRSTHASPLRNLIWDTTVRDTLATMDRLTCMMRSMQKTATLSFQSPVWMQTRTTI